MIKKICKWALASAVIALAINVHASDSVKVGVILSTTGPAASLGIPERNTISLLPTTLGDRKVEYIMLDDETDPGVAGRNARRLIEQEKVDVIIGSTAVPTSIAAAEVAAENQTVTISLAPYIPTENQHPWTFPLPQTVAVMSESLFADMAKQGIKRLAYIGFSDNWGQAWLADIDRHLIKHGLELVATERYARSDRSVAGQILRVLGSRPDAVLIGASGTPGVLPMSTLRERGFKGVIYQTHGMANQDVLRLAGSSAEGMILPTGAVLVAELLPENHPSKRQATEFVKSYESRHGEGSRNNFAAYAYDAYLLLNDAVKRIDGSIKPGTPAFRNALRDKIENTHELAVSHGVVSWGVNQRSAFDARGAVLITVKDGNWALVE
ncbi:MAG TPA: ABC transporter substrate-binding protein [Marinospirillum sp.]|uniref:ABC transporter substrate-binding protein n=1 Tax=Marinospirillum sp. TaxID=2183934 RepID=UPI002B49CE2A|nr:ABC transporter substrate-binding protein [Marinospirillum sp.]HKM16588.1 ABC transporter substrate-binding protein [Marinospirillum sp.]